MYDNYRLLSFNPYDGEKAAQDNEDPMAQKSGAKEFLVQMFGINETGETAAIYVEGFDPFFYIKVGDDWGEAQKLGFTLQLKKDMGQYHEEAVSETKLIKRKKLYGFDDNKMHTFMLIKFKNEIDANTFKLKLGTTPCLQKYGIYENSLDSCK